MPTAAKLRSNDLSEGAGMRTPLAVGPQSVLVLFVLREPVSQLGRLDAAMIDYVRQCHIGRGRVG